ncbi:MAG TPA: hypothetical protein VHB46_01485 [Burkholderiales bacterium]|nr:hypothetical protein [Burkholderiales bacterium]
MSTSAQYEFREGFRIVSEAIVEQLGENGVAITAEGVTHTLTWQPGAPVPTTVTFQIAPIGRKPVKVEFSNEEIEDCWEGLDRAEVRRKLCETVEKFTVADIKQPEPTDKEKFDAAVAVLKMNFPRIHQNIVALWGSPQGEVFLDGLIVDDRGGRQGFPRDAMQALLLLQRVHFQKFGTFRKVDPWDVVKFGK